MPTVLLVAPVAETGGSDQALLRLVTSLRTSGWACHVVLPGPSQLAPAFASVGATLHVVPMRRITTSGGAGWWVRYALEWPFAVARIARVARRRHVDVVASNSLHSWYGWAAAALVRRPHLWHAREIVVQSRAALRLERELVRRSARLLVACSAAVAEQFADVLASDRVVVVHEDVDRSHYAPRRAGRLRARLGLEPAAPLVGFVGRIDTWKGLDVLLGAWPAVRSAEPRAQLVVVGPAVAGKEDYASGLRRRAEALDGVHWLGPVDDAADVMADLDVFAAPSTLPEPYGLVLVEALASGARVVTTDAGGAPEVVDRAQPAAGRLVPPGDAGALAAAVVALLHDADAATKRLADRAERPPLIAPFPTDWTAVYGRVLGPRR